jgi:hypothetical protein
VPQRPDGQTTDPAAQAPPAADADAEPVIDPIPLPGAAGPLGGSNTGELVDAVDQPMTLPGQCPPLSTDAES